MCVHKRRHHAINLPKSRRGNVCKPHRACAAACASWKQPRSCLRVSQIQELRLHAPERSEGVLEIQRGVWRAERLSMHVRERLKRILRNRDHNNSMNVAQKACICNRDLEIGTIEHSLRFTPQLRSCHAMAHLNGCIELQHRGVGLDDI